MKPLFDFGPATPIDTAHAGQSRKIPVVPILFLGIVALTLASPVAALRSVDEVTLTNRGDVGASYLTLDDAGIAHITYVYGSGFAWGDGLGYVQVNDLTMQNEAEFLPGNGFIYSGAALPVPLPGGGAAFFHHQWSTTLYEQFFFTTVNDTGGAVTSNMVTPVGGCTNTDANTGAVDLGDSTYAFVYTSCRETGVDDVQRNNLFYTRMSAQGLELVPDRVIDSSGTVRPSSETVVAGAGVLHVAYIDWRSGNDSLYYQQIDYAGNVVVPGGVVPGSTGSAKDPRMVLDSSGDLHLFWQDDSLSTGRLHHLVLDASGTPQGPSTILAESMEAIRTPNPVIDPEDEIHLVWRSAGSLLYQKIAVSGATLDGPDTLDIEAAAFLRSVAIGENENVHLVYTGSNLDAYYVRFPTEVATGVAGRPALPVAPRLVASPNPFNPSTTIRFDSGNAGRVAVVIHDVAGRTVRTLRDGWTIPGPKAILWDGRDDAGNSVPSGAYFARVRADGRYATSRLTLVR